MHADHRLPRARAELMNRFGDQFLARAALALQQHRGGRRRHLFDHIKYLAHRRRFADDIFHSELRVELLVERDVFRFEIPLAQ